MSFYVEFTAASHDDALRIVLAEEFCPTVCAFICQALEAYRAARAITSRRLGILQQGLRGKQRGVVVRNHFGSPSELAAKG
jgi:hypothetical protein